MLMTLFVLLLVLWLVGVLTSPAGGGIVHLLPILAAAVLLVRLRQGRRPI